MANAIIVRQATDDFNAFKVADAMQRLSYVDVVSIVFENGRWHVFAKYDDQAITPATIDASIDRDEG